MSASAIGELLSLAAQCKIDLPCSCIQLNQPAFNEPEDPTSWAELLTKLKENLIHTFDANVSVYEEETRKIDSQRSLPGWNFCTFFIQKVGCLRLLVTILN